MAKQTIPADLAKAGFVIPEVPKQRRLLVGTQGQTKCGKTEWALRAPRPIAMINIDLGLEGVVEKHLDRPGLYVAKFTLPPIIDQKKYQEIWKRCNTAYQAMTASKEIRTMILDGADDIWDLMRGAEFGMAKPLSTQYTAVNMLYRGLIRSAYDSGKNLIAIHKVKKEYAAKGDSKLEAWTGSYERTGFSDSAYLIQVNVEHVTKVDPKTKKVEFGTRVLNCRHDMGLCGEEFWGEDNSFAMLAASIFGTGLEEWQ